MRTLGDLSDQQLRDALTGRGLRIRVGPYVYAIQSPLPVVHQGLRVLYRDFALADDDGYADYHVGLRSVGPLNRLRRQLDFTLDGQRPFGQIAYEHAYAFLEWGMNWCVSIYANEYLKLHAAVVAKNGVAVIMPGLPGAGKSTLCAALALSGWRVLSDEHALVPLGSSNVAPLYRPVSLKNESIQVISKFRPDAVLGPETRETHKGVVAHLKADLDPGTYDIAPLPARLILFPQYVAGETAQVIPKTCAESFIFAAHHSFNYSLLSAAGFETMTTLLDAVRCCDLRYGDLDEGIRALEELHALVCEA